VALLVPDGRVITAGSNPARKNEELRIKVFWPPYLFAGPMPTCNPSATEVSYGDSVSAAVETAQIASTCLIGPGAITHSLNSEQRLVDLPIQVTGPEAVLLQRPGTATIAPPGWYLLMGSTQRGFPPKAAGSTSPKRRMAAATAIRAPRCPKTAMASSWQDEPRLPMSGRHSSPRSETSGFLSQTRSAICSTCDASACNIGVVREESSNRYRLCSGASPDRGLEPGAVVMHRFPRQDCAVPPGD
jgi:hypothetical protein